MPARGYSVTPKKKRKTPKVRPKAPTMDERRGQSDVRAIPQRVENAVKTAKQVDKARAKVRAGKGPKADTGDVTRNAPKMTREQQRRAIGRDYPSGKQSALSQAVSGPSAATKLRDAALLEFDSLHGDADTRRRAKLKLAIKDPERGAKANIGQAPAIKVLDQTLRPIRAVAGSTEQVIKGHPEKVPGAVKKGLIDNKGPTFSKILKDAGAPKGVAAVGGFALDVALDPTTYVTAGASVPARKAAEKAAREATQRAAVAGASKKAADKAGRAAAAKVVADPPLMNKGLTVGVRAKVPFTKKPQIDVRTSGKTTAAISRKTGISKAATAIREGDNRVARTIQRHGPEAVHDFRPKGVTPQQHAKVRQAQREFRADTAKARREAERQMQALRKAVPDQRTAERIIDHIESGAPLRDLGGYAGVARQIRKMQGQDFDAKKARGLMHLAYKPGRTKDKAGNLVIDPLKALTEPQRYLPRVRRIDLEPNRAGQINRATGRTKAKVGKPRTMRDPMVITRQTHPSVFSEDLPAVLTHSRLNTRETAAVADFWQKVAKTGRPLRKGAGWNQSEEMIFKVTPQGLEPLVKAGKDRAPDFDAIGKALDPGAGRHVILNRDQYERIARSAEDNRVPLGQTIDRAQGLWKTAVTATPGFHIRNLVGDTQLAHTADTAAPAFNQARQLLVAKAHRNKRQRGAVGGGADNTQPMTIGGKTQSREAWVDEAERFGAIDQGFMGREIEQQAKRSPGKLMRGLQYREDMPRLATYISARERGMTPPQAAGHVATHHFDYGDLTATEKAVRRYGVPFWTFFARNTRLQTTKLITRPGKATTLAKLMEESAILAGFKDYADYAEKLPDNQQRGLPIPIKTDKGVTSWTYMPPASDLNILSTKPADFAQNVAQRITAAKLVAEMYANYSVFFQGPIERENAKLVPAPTMLGSLPASVRKKMGVEKFRDKRRGVIWGWPAKTDYMARQFPQTNLLVQALTPVPGSRGKSGAQSAIGTATGFRPSTYNAAVEDEAIRRAAKKLHDLTAKRNNLLRTPAAKDGFGFASPQLQALRAQIKTEEARLEKLKGARGDDIEQQRVDNPPLPPDQELRKKYEDMRKRREDAGGDLRDKYERMRRERDYLRSQRGG